MGMGTQGLGNGGTKKRDGDGPATRLTGSAVRCRKACRRHLRRADVRDGDRERTGTARACIASYLYSYLLHMHVL